MNPLLPTDIDSLLEDRPGPCISLYVPLSRSGARTQQGAIRLKNLLGGARLELCARGLDEMAIETLLGPLEDLLDDASFWNTEEEGVALFRAPGFTRAFHLSPSFPERSTVSDRFFLKPLLPLVAPDDTFYVLALSQNEVRLLEADGRVVHRVELEALPHDLVAALGEQKTAQYLTYHTASKAPAGALPAIYHGRGVGAGDRKEELRRYLSQVEAALRTFFAGRTAPLVLAGAEPLPFLYQEVCRYPHLVREVISGNPEHWTDEELRDRAWQLLAPAFDEARSRAAERFGELAGTGRASSDVREIVPAARQGRIEALFFASDVDLWGRIDDPPGKVRVHAEAEEGDEELLDAAALFSLRAGGTVYGVSRGEVPGGGEIAAVFRY